MDAAGATAPALRDGQAEARLMGVYQLIAEGRHREALAQAEALARDYPHFQLAQLVVGDLLMARTRPIRRLGDVPEPDSARSLQAAATLEELRNESRQRVDAQRSRPPAHSIPAQFLELSPRTRHAIAVDASRSRLYLFENTAKGLQLVADYYASVGKLGIEKNLEGDQRTPLGVYFITSRLDPATRPVAASGCTARRPTSLPERPWPPMAAWCWPTPTSNASCARWSPAPRPWSSRASCSGWCRTRCTRTANPSTRCSTPGAAPRPRAT
jgi:hypothetical protein